MINNSAILFTAPSGTGKSTHTRMWQECFGERVTVINDDKPLIKINDSEAVIYGTPWCGKHGIETMQRQISFSVSLKRIKQKLR